MVESAIDENSEPEALYAALDLGTNSCRMLIAQPKGAQFHVIDSFAKSVQLGSGLEKTGRLSRDLSIVLFKPFRSANKSWKNMM